ncbi:site-specific DNA-methyltransferase [Heliorestis convoluta]|uniref:Site-specific DNA-methyltransferase n=1 Tax=Heliorestis convoluta TaxID=356322 RepID=A0A5Q2N365_9FIRM|nr:site-specific DNA-methyltransferase [Heliorestis convoluta]QGG48036.1 Site-specific DNA-methyltransferase [Heliorestis convoluta]
MEFPKVPKEIFNPINENIKKLAELFPSVVKDGQIDLEALKAELGHFESTSEKLSERYELGWAGKEASKKLANQDVVGRTLKYIPEDSKNPETTENLYIEGDNLEVLKLLRNCYYNKIKMIYIDPPYNTGNDFVYKDNFSIAQKENGVLEGELDKNGERLIVNQKSSGRYHSNWLSMMYPRLKISKDLLTEDGVVFISIDDNEIENLRKLCNEIFGRENYIESIIWYKNSTKNDSKDFATIHEYIICYAKNKAHRRDRGLTFREKKLGFEQVMNLAQKWELENTDIEDAQKEVRLLYRNNRDFKGLSQYKYVEIVEGKYKIYRKDNAAWPQGEGPKYDVIHPITKKPCQTPKRGWRWKKETMDDLLKHRLICFGEDESIVPQFKRYLDTMESNIVKSVYVNNNNGDVDLRETFKKTVFEHPKPISLIKDLCLWATRKDSMILDFFSGSATTAHSVMQLNAEDDGCRKFIMVQLPEPCDEKSEAYKAGYKNICEIGKERIRRAGEKILEENKDKAGIENLDIGFKVFRTADTNIRWFSEAIKNNELFDYDNRRSDKDNLDFNPSYKDIDVVYEILLRHRDIPLSSSVDKLSSIGERTYIFADTVLVCLEENITETMIDKIAAIEPMPSKIIFRDSAFEADISLKSNSMLRLEAQMKKNSGTKKKAYRVEFI